MTAPGSAQDGLDLDEVDVSRLGYARHRELAQRLAELREAILLYRGLSARHRTAVVAGRDRGRDAAVGALFEARSRLHDAGQAVCGLASECFGLLSETYAFVYTMIAELDPHKVTIAEQAQPLADLLAHLASLTGPEVPEDVRDRVDEVVSALVLAAEFAVAHVEWMAGDFDLPDVQEARALVAGVRIPRHADAEEVLRQLTDLLALNGAAPTALSTFFGVLVEWLGEARDLARQLHALGERCAAVQGSVSSRLADLEIDEVDREALARLPAELEAFEREMADSSDSDVQLTDSDSDSGADAGPGEGGPRVLGDVSRLRMPSIDHTRLDLPALVVDDDRLVRAAKARKRSAEEYRKAREVLAGAGSGATVSQCATALTAVEDLGSACAGELKTAFRAHLRTVEATKNEVRGLLAALDAATSAAGGVADLVGELPPVPSPERDTRVKNACGHVVTALRDANRRLGGLAPLLTEGARGHVGTVVGELLAHFLALPRLEGFTPAVGGSMTGDEFDRARVAARTEVRRLIDELDGVLGEPGTLLARLADAQSLVEEAVVRNDNLVSALREVAEELRQALHGQASGPR